MQLMKLLHRTSAIAADPTKETIQGTSLVLLEGVAGRLGVSSYVKATTSDGDKTLAVRAGGVAVTMPGQAQIPAKRLYQILKLCPEGRTKIEVSGDAAVITSGRARWTIQCPKSENILAVPNLTAERLFPVDTRSLLQAISSVRKAVSPTPARVSLMQLDIRGGFATACDGGRVHKRRIDGLSEDVEFSIPYKAVAEIVKALTDTEEQVVHLRFSDYAFELMVGDDSFISAQLTVDFPDIDYMLVNPSVTNENSLSVSTEELTEAIKRVKVSSDPDYSAIFLSLVSGPKDADGDRSWTLNIKARDKRGNSAQELLDVQWQGISKPKEICVNYGYLLDLLEASEKEIAILSIGEDLKSKKYPVYLENKEIGFTGIVQQMSTEYI